MPTLLESLAQQGETQALPGRWLHDAPAALPAAVRWDHIEGLLLGIAIGDSLGNRSEAMPPASRRALHGELRDYLPNRWAGGRAVGLPSDDTQLAFRTLECLLVDNTIVPDRLASAFASRRIFGLGRTVRAFLRELKRDGCNWRQAAQRSAGNGALMRIAPVVVPYVRHPDASLWHDAALAGLVTHNDPASIGACVGFVRALWGSLGQAGNHTEGWWLETVTDRMREIEGDQTLYSSRTPHLSYQGPMWRFVREEVERALREDLPCDIACDRWYSGAFLLETLPSVLYILERHGRDAEEAIVRAVNDTWDNDTCAAIVGAAVGGSHGAAAFPARWREGLLGRTSESDDGRVYELIDSARARWWSAHD